MSQNQHLNKLYLQETHKLNEAIAYTDSVVMKQIFEVVKDKLLNLPKPKEPMSRTSFRRYASTIQSLISQTFSDYSYLLKNEISSKANKDANKYSKVLAKRLGLTEALDTYKGIVIDPTDTSDKEYTEDEYKSNALQYFLSQEDYLTNEAVTGIKGWTGNWYGYIRDIFSGIDNSDSRQYIKMQGTIDEAAEGIKSLFDKYAYDNKKSKLYRGINMSKEAYEDFIDGLEVGGLYSPGRRPSSWTYDKDMAKSFAGRLGRAKKVILTIEDAKGLGYNLHDISDYANESEILLRDNEHFEIVSLITDDNVTKITIKPTVNYAGATFTRPSRGIADMLNSEAFDGILSRLSYHESPSDYTLTERVEILKAFTANKKMVPDDIQQGVKDWTDGWSAYIRQVFEEDNGISDKWRPQDREAILRTVKNLKKLFNEYAYDSVQPELFRGLHIKSRDYDAFMKKLKEGGTYSVGKHPSSWTSNYDLAEQFAIKGSSNKAILLSIEGAEHLGYNISGLSKKSYEEEVLLRDRESFIIKSIDQDGEITKVVLSPKVDYKALRFGIPSTPSKENLFAKPNLKFNDKSIDQMYKSLANSISTNARQKVSDLYMNGKTSHDISLAIAKGFGLSTDEDGLSDKAIKQRAKAFFNTSLSLVREATRAEAERAYEQYISGWEFDAHMDGRTTSGCKALEGHKFMKKGPNSTKEETIPPDAIVPRHFNCRSIHIVIPYKHNEEWKLISQKEIIKGDKKYLKSIWNKEIR